MLHDNKMMIETTDSIEMSSDDDQSPVSSVASFNKGEGLSFDSMDHAVTRTQYTIEGPESIEVEAPFRNFESKGRSNGPRVNYTTTTPTTETMEVHAAGKNGLVDYSTVYTNDSSHSSVISSGDSINEDGKDKTKRKDRAIRPYTGIAFLVFVVCLIIGLGAGIGKTNRASSNQASNFSSDTDLPNTTSPVDSNSGSDPSEGNVSNDDENGDVASDGDAEEDDPSGEVDGDIDTDGSDSVQDEDVDEGAVPGRDDVTESPTPAQTESASDAATMDNVGGTGGDCPEHDVVATSSCQGDLNSTSTIITFCFQSVADGDWYWIRSSDDSINYDSWAYMDGASEGSVELFDLPQGTYKASTVRDSMRPYTILATADFTVPDCSTL